LNKFIIFFIILFFFTEYYNIYGQSTGYGNDTVSIPEIVVTANKFQVSPLLSPNKIQLLNNEIINTVNNSTLSDVLNLADGIFIRDYGFNSGLKTVSLNFTQPEHSVILYNGIKINSLQNSLFDISLFSSDDIHSVEISKGGSSSLYGTDAVGGVINIITKNENISNKPIGFNFKSEFGSYGFFRSYINLEGNTKSFYYYCSGEYENSKNNFDYYYHDLNGKEIKERENSDYKKSVFSLDISCNLNKYSSLKFFSNYNYFDRNIAGITTGINNLPSNQIDKNLITSVGYAKKYSNYTFSSSLVYKYGYEKYVDPNTFSTSQIVNSYYKMNTILFNSDYSLLIKHKLSLFFGNEISFADLISNETKYGKNIQLSFTSAAKLIYIPKLIFFPSVRYDYISNINQNVMTGKLGVNYKPFENYQFTLKSTVGNNFRAPSFNDLYWKNLGNPDLNPEKSISFDAGFYYDVIYLMSKNHFEVSYFYISTDNRIIWKPDIYGIWRPGNIGKVRSDGIELNLGSEIIFTSKLLLKLNFNYNYSKALKKNSDYIGDKTFDKQLPYIPQELSKLNFRIDYKTAFSFLKRLSFNFFYTFTGKRFSDLENSRYVSHYDLLDANLVFELYYKKIGTDIKFCISNITNKDYEVIDGYPMPLRNYKLQFSFKY
jgi:vitamin B12 transporter